MKIPLCQPRPTPRVASRRCRPSGAPILFFAAMSPATSSISWSSETTMTGNGGTLNEVQTKTVLDLIKRAKVGSKFLKYMKAQSVEETGSLGAAVATIAARDYRKAISTLEEQIAKAEAGRADLS